MQRKILVLAVAGLIGAGGLGYAGDSETAKEVKKAILEANAHTAKTLKSLPDSYSKDGALEFWSSGGLMQWVPADTPPADFEAFAIKAKHIKVIPLVEGQAAVALFYSEGSLTPKGSAAVNHYLTRVTQVFVKEDGKWKVRASHWSPVTGGSGTTQTSLDE